MPKLRTLEICGFRSFVSEQRLTFESNLSLIWASNSQGKTSIAEAIEFLFTGTTNRRELLGGAKSEFEGMLRNVHLASDASVWVKATIADDAGNEHIACRTLVSDYTAEKECTSELTIDGVSAPDLSALGLTLFDPPLRAPVLLQHSLRFALSARPQDRADYFKGLLEVQDLDRLAELVDAQVANLKPVSTEFTLKLGELTESGKLSTLRADLNASALTDAEVETILGTAVSTALGDLGEDDGATLSVAERAEALRVALEARRQTTFPVGDYAVGPALAPLPQPTLEKLIDYQALAEAVETEAESLRNLFEAVLAIPTLAHTESHIDCPVCETPDALTPERISTMREKVAEAQGLRAAQKVAQTELDGCVASLNVLDAACGNLVPRFARPAEAELSDREAVLIELIGSPELHRTAFDDATALDTANAAVVQASQALRVALREVKTAVEQAKKVDVESLVTLTSATNDAVAATAGPRTKSEVAVVALLVQVKEAIDKRQGLDQWRGLTESTADYARFAGALRAGARSGHGPRAVRAGGQGDRGRQAQGLRRQVQGYECRDQSLVGIAAPR